MKRGTIKRLCSTIPTKPGTYYWDEWGAHVKVVKRGKVLYVTPPGANRIEIKVTPNIAGVFVEARP